MSSDVIPWLGIPLGTLAIFVIWQLARKRHVQIQLSLELGGERRKVRKD